MLFKDELPPPRHTLDSGDFEDSDANVEVTHDAEVWIPNHSVDRILLLAPKCASLALQLGGTPCGRIVITTQRRLTALEATTADYLYETESVDTADFTTKQSWTLPIYTGPAGLVIISAAALPEAEANYAAGVIMTQFDFKALFVATPGLSFMREPVCCLATQSAVIPDGVPLASPPVIVQGISAAMLSQARQHTLSALALVVSADGPTNHEIIDEDKFDGLRSALFRALGLRDIAKSRVDREISTLYV